MSKFKEAQQEYERLLQEREEKINIEVAKAKEELKKASRKSYKEAKESERSLNEAPCSVCGNRKFILKYRDVNGETHGKISGSFSLFGGHISGYIDGYTQTGAVLSCRDCQNERKIVLKDWNSGKDIWFQQLPTVFSSKNFTDYPPKDWLKEKGLEVARIIDNDYYHEYSSNDLSKLSDSELESVGLVNKYPLPQKPRWWNYTIFS